MTTARRVAITGLGGVFPTVGSVDEFSAKIFGNGSLVREWPTAVARARQLRSQVAGFIEPEECGLQVKRAELLEDYPELYEDLRGRIPLAHLATADLGSVWAMIASRDAITNAGWTDDLVQNERTGVVIGTGGGGHVVLRKTWENFFIHDKKSRLLTAHNVDRTMTYRDAANVSCLIRSRGVCESIGSACACGLGNIGYAYRLIKHGYQDRCLAGSTEGTSLESFLGFDAMQVLARKFPAAESSRPFALDRNGFVCSFGCAIIALEELESARRRGAHILAVIDGYHNNSDGSGDMFAPSHDGQRRLIEGLRSDCIDTVGLDLDPQVDVVKAHGTSTPVGDIVELTSIAEQFGLEGYHIAAPKSQFGHMLGAAGSVELLLCVLMLREQKVSPCLNSENLSEKLEEAQEAADWRGLRVPPAELRHLLPTRTIAKPIRSIVSLNYGFGGTNAAMRISHPGD